MEIERLSVRGRYRVWCDDCQDGYQGGKTACERWRARHMYSDRHAGEEEP